MLNGGLIGGGRTQAGSRRPLRDCSTVHLVTAHTGAGGKDPRTSTDLHAYLEHVCEYGGRRRETVYATCGSCLPSVACTPCRLPAGFACCWHFHPTSASGSGGPRRSIPEEVGSEGGGVSSPARVDLRGCSRWHSPPGSARCEQDGRRTRVNFIGPLDRFNLLSQAIFGTGVE